MAANVETMFSVKETPWHGLGTIIQDAPTSEEAIKLAGLDWDVISTPVMVNNEEVLGYSANVRNSDNSVLGIVSQKYKIVQNKEAFSFIDELLMHDVKFETAGALDNGKRVWMLAKLPEENILGDAITPYMVFTNGHDGKNAITLTQCATRVVCQNTLSAALAEGRRQYTFKHMGNLESKVLEAQISLKLTHKYMDSLKGFAENMLAKKISEKKLEVIINQIFPIDDETTDRVKNNIIFMRDSFKEIYKNTNDIQNFKGTGWGVYNAFADMATHVRPLRETKNFQEKRFISFIDGNKLLLSAQEVLMAA